MGLGSVSQTALSGMAAASLSIEVVANNLANANTPGFKASSVSFATQTPQTSGSGASPSRQSGGTNPTQVGSGVRGAAVTADFSQGSIAMGSNPLSLALQGDGLFILEGSGAARSYTRDGSFSLDAASNLVTSGGQRVLGYAADENHQIQTAELTSLRISIGRQVAGEDGAPTTLTGFSVNSDGRIIGQFTDGNARDLGQIAMARFTNPSGLEQGAGTSFSAGPNSGLPVEGSATITAGGTELSNTDVGQSLVDLATASVLFRANVQVLATGEGMFDQLLDLTRRS